MDDFAKINGLRVPIMRCNTLVVGSGAAGLNAADRLFSFGQNSIAILTEGRNFGTSRNAGSDKQTYYKLTMAGDAADSVQEMAETLFNGQAMHGDLALVEAALSARCFYRLVEIGVPFPSNRFGELIGYKTDHDPRQRATSAGPLTSRIMTERFLDQVLSKNIPIYDGYQAIAILTDPGRTRSVGLLALNLNGISAPDDRYALFNCTNIVYATGGPAGMHADSVYPTSQTGATGIALEAGTPGQNLTEGQFGLASIGFRWNVSGTYQQVLPRYISTDGDGKDEREFLFDYFEEPADALNAVFLKGYQWPFDSRKVSGRGSSLVDLCVYYETVHRGRRVFLDYRTNPLGQRFAFALLNQEACSYLEKSGALFGTPIERLSHMNQPAIDLYRNNGIDLTREPLEVAVCAQHTNGGLQGNHWWESPLAHFFPIGEANGSHGVYRPGGSALNSGQVGGTRAAGFIAARYPDEPVANHEFLSGCRDQVEAKITLGEHLLTSGQEGTAAAMRRKIGRRMSDAASIIRDPENVSQALEVARTDFAEFSRIDGICGPHELSLAFQNYDLLICQIVFLTAIKDYLLQGGGSRGSYLVGDRNGESPGLKLPDSFRFKPDDGRFAGSVQTVSYRNGECIVRWKPVRPIPREEQWFETVWREYMKDGNIR